MKNPAPIDNLLFSVRVEKKSNEREKKKMAKEIVMYRNCSATYVYVLRSA